MSIEFLNNLENKIDGLIENYKRIKEDNGRLMQELEQAKGRLSEIESNNLNLRNEVSSLKANSQGCEEKLNATAEKIQGLLSKLESVQ